jgi:putative restriction endonuclease
LISNLLKDEGWDKPFFKVLAQNDTAAARGHQGGAVIPKTLWGFFPSLDGITTRELPTIDHRISAELFIEDEYVATVDTRYQVQTWGNTRTPEARLTGNLGPLRNLASGDDVLIIQRSLQSLDQYRLILVRKTSAEYRRLAASLKGHRWGLLEDTPPMTQSDFDAAKKAEADAETAEFELFDPNAGLVQIHGARIARSVVFSETVKRLYRSTCCVCGISARSPCGRRDFEAAHIVPRSLKGKDDARNGLGLCKGHHWAFDLGLFGVDKDRKVHVPKAVRSFAENSALAQLSGRALALPAQSNLEPALEALDWHFSNRVRQYD